MTKDKALRLALEALTVLLDEWTPARQAQLKGMEAVTAIKAALEAKDEPVAFFDWYDNAPWGNEDFKEGCHRAWNAAIKYTAKPNQEAKDEIVAWRDAAIRLGEELSSVGPDGYYDMDAKEWLDWAMEQNPRGEHSLPQRTWVGLTDMDIAIIDWESLVTRKDCVRAIEDKLKEKNT